MKYYLIILIVLYLLSVGTLATAHLYDEQFRIGTSTDKREDSVNWMLLITLGLLGLELIVVVCIFAFTKPPEENSNEHIPSKSKERITKQPKKVKRRTR